MNLKALYENLLSNQTPETINEASTQRVNVSPGQRILEGLSNEKAITSRRRAVKESISARDLPRYSNFPHEILNKRKHELKNQPSNEKIDNYFSDESAKSNPILESSQPMRIFHTETLEDYDALMMELGGYRIKPLVGHRWKENGKNTVVYVHSEKGRFYMEYGSIVEATSKYPDVPIEKYKADKALQKAGKSVRSGEELDLEDINESTSNKRIRPRIQEGSVKFPDLSKLKNSKKPKLLKEAAGDEEEFETPQDELEKDLSSENSTDSVEEETTGFSLDDAVLIDGDLVLTISKDSGHVVNITLTDIDLDEEVLVYAKSGEENEEEERLSESAKLRKKFLSGKH